MRRTDGSHATGGGRSSSCARKPCEQSPGTIARRPRNGSRHQVRFVWTGVAVAVEAALLRHTRTVQGLEGDAVGLACTRRGLGSPHAAGSQVSRRLASGWTLLAPNGRARSSQSPFPAPRGLTRARRVTNSSVASSLPCPPRRSRPREGSAHAPRGPHLRGGHFLWCESNVRTTSSVLAQSFHFCSRCCEIAAARTESP